MAERPFADRLARESEVWVAEGLVTAEQAAAIRARYGEPEDARSRAASALAVVGSVAVGVGVIAFFAANWSGIPKALRLVLLVVALLAAYGTAYHLRERTGRLPRVGAALHLLGVLLFGASLFLVGQMYNVEAHDPLALLIWAAGAAAVAAVVRTRPLTWAAFVIFTAWAAWETGTALDGGGGDEFAALAALAMPYGAALYGGGTFVRERVRRAWVDETGAGEVARRVGLLVGLVGLVAFTFQEPAEELAGAARDAPGTVQAVAGLLIAAALAAAAGLVASGRRSGAGEGAVVAVVALATGVALVTGGDGVLWAIVFNLLLAAVALGAIGAGYVADEPWLVNAGIAVVAVDLVARYFDFFWDALGRSLGIIGSGVVVLLLAWGLERQRKRVLARMDA